MNRTYSYVCTALTLLVVVFLAALEGDCAEFFEIGEGAVRTVSGDGRVVIGSGTHSSWDGHRGWLWTREDGIKPLPSAFPDGNSMYPIAISFDGSMIVGNERSSGNPHAVRWTQQTGTVIFDLNGQFEGSMAGNVTSAGIVAGRGLISGNQPGTPVQWTDAGGLEVLDELPLVREPLLVSDDGTAIAGSTARLGSQSAFVWNGRDGIVHLGVLPHKDHSSVNDLSADGTVVVGQSGVDVLDRTPEAFRWTPETGMEGLGALPGHTGGSDAQAVTADGTVIVGNSAGVPHLHHRFNYERAKPFVWDEHHGMRDLEQLLRTDHGMSDLPPLRWTRGISDDTKTLVGASWAIYLDKPLIRPWGDVNDDHYRDVADIDLLSQAIQAASSDDAFDLNSDGLVNEHDRQYWIFELAETFFGDSNLDGEFNSSDLVAVFEAGQYDDSVAGNSTWGTGDWNGDSEFSSADLVLAFQYGDYEQGSQDAVSAVPEPGITQVLLWGTVLLCRRIRKQRPAELHPRGR